MILQVRLSSGDVITIPERDVFPNAVRDLPSLGTDANGKRVGFNPEHAVSWWEKQEDEPKRW